jgi:pimeloyl-ACP methyl ester carboxylesterase
MDEPGKMRRCVMIHGAGGGGWEWAIWQRVFAARGWDVLAPDLQPADGGLEATILDDYLEQARQWCGAAAPDLLVGASLGGLIALAIASEVRPGALVLINPVPPDSGHVPADAYPARIPWGLRRSLEGTRRAMPDADAAACLLAFRRWRDESGAVLNGAMGGLAFTAPKCPMLVVASADDEDVPADSSRKLAYSLNAAFLPSLQTSHVGPLLGRRAAQIAKHVALWAEERRKD